MTSREERLRVATAAMAALIQTYDTRKDPPEVMPGEIVAAWAVMHADALLAKLAATEPKPPDQVIVPAGWDCDKGRHVVNMGSMVCLICRKDIGE